MNRYVRSESATDGKNCLFYGIKPYPEIGGKGIYLGFYDTGAGRLEFGPMLPSQARFMAQKLLHFADASEFVEEEIAA